MDILNDVGVSKLSAKVFFFKVNFSFKGQKIGSETHKAGLRLVISYSERAS